MSPIATKHIILMAGYPGSGKSTLAKKICQRFGFEHLSSDQMREELFKQTRYDAAGDAAVDPKRADAYQLMYAKALELVSDGKQVVLDGTHVEPAKYQKPLANLLTQVDPSKLCFILVNPAKAEIDTRMAQFHQPNSETETIYEGWQRVYGYFEEKEKSGLVCWPSPEIGIEMYPYADIISQLD